MSQFGNFGVSTVLIETPVAHFSNIAPAEGSEYAKTGRK